MDFSEHRGHTIHKTGLHSWERKVILKNNKTNIVDNELNAVVKIIDYIVKFDPFPLKQLL